TPEEIKKPAIPESVSREAVKGIEVKASEPKKDQFFDTEIPKFKFYEDENKTEGVSAEPKRPDPKPPTTEDKIKSSGLPKETVTPEEENDEWGRGRKKHFGK
ncbi:MAG: hypothetical protein NTV06_00575, partial [candidate division Zixibacteria bacterium]|nr:hypothetical protein [candidate division Zixibacteria bacterium]